jgi:hypothetical protein
MVEKHLQEIEIIGVSLEILKALIGMSQINDADWDGVANILNDYSFRLRSAVDGIRNEIPNNSPMVPPGRNPSRTCSKSSRVVRGDFNV